MLKKRVPILILLFCFAGRTGRSTRNRRCPTRRSSNARSRQFTHMIANVGHSPSAEDALSRDPADVETRDPFVIVGVVVVGRGMVPFADFQERIVER